MMELFEKYYTLSLHFISYRPRSKKETMDFLSRKKAPLDIAKKIVATLEEEGLVSDEKFAIWWIDQRNTFRPRGIRLLRLELREKGIAEDLIEEILSGMESQETQVATASALIKKRVYKMQNMSYSDMINKLRSFLERKGFDYSVIQRAIDDLEGKEV